MALHEPHFTILDSVTNESDGQENLQLLVEEQKGWLLFLRCEMSLLAELV